MTTYFILPYSVSKTYYILKYHPLINALINPSLCNTPHYNYILCLKCIPQKVTKHLTPISSSESPDTTHTFSTGTSYSAVMELVRRRFQIYSQSWCTGEGHSFFVFAGSAIDDKQCHLKEYLLPWCDANTTNQQSNFIMHYSSCIWQNPATPCTFTDRQHILEEYVASILRKEEHYSHHYKGL